MDSTDELDEDDQLLNYAIQLSIEESWSNDFPARHDAKETEKIPHFFKFSLLLLISMYVTVDSHLFYPKTIVWKIKRFLMQSKGVRFAVKLWTLYKFKSNARCMHAVHTIFTCVTNIKMSCLPKCSSGTPFIPRWPVYPAGDVEVPGCIYWGGC